MHFNKDMQVAIKSNSMELLIQFVFE